MKFLILFSIYILQIICCMLYDFCVLKNNTKSFTLRDVIFGDGSLLMQGWGTYNETELRMAWSISMPMLKVFAHDIKGFPNCKKQKLITVFGYTKFIPFIPVLASMLYFSVFLILAPFRIGIMLIKTISEKAADIKFDGNL